MAGGLSFGMKSWRTSLQKVILVALLLTAYPIGCPVREVILDPVVAMQMGHSRPGEALVYGEAEGGEGDEDLFRSICVLLQPPLTIAQMSNKARWSVVQSYNLLKLHGSAHKAAIKALENAMASASSSKG